MKLFILLLTLVLLTTQQCHPTCATCNGGSLPTNCLTCNSADHRSFWAGSCPCDLRFYDDGNPTCQPCDYTCRTCSGGLGSNCLTCDFFKNRQHSGTSGTDGTCDCLTSYFDDGLNNEECVACHYTCYTCTGPNDNDCILCDDANTFRTNDGSGHCICNHQYFDDLSNVSACKPCHFSCATCDGLDDFDCLSCDATRDQIGTTCICKDGYYQVNLQ